MPSTDYLSAGCPALLDSQRANHRGNDGTVRKIGPIGGSDVGTLGEDLPWGDSSAWANNHRDYLSRADSATDSVTVIPQAHSGHLASGLWYLVSDGSSLALLTARHVDLVQLPFLVSLTVPRNAPKGQRSWNYVLVNVTIDRKTVGIPIARTSRRVRQLGQLATGNRHGHKSSFLAGTGRNGNFVCVTHVLALSCGIICGDSPLFPREYLRHSRNLPALRRPCEFVVAER